MPPKTHDLSGRRFGSLQVIRWDGYSKRRGGRSLSYWVCKCDCGIEKSFMAWDLHSGGVESCGCKGREKAMELARSLGLSHTRNAGPVAARQLYANYKHGAKKRGLEFSISYEEAVAMYRQPCMYCGEHPSKINVVKNSFFVYNGIDRVDNGLGYISGNCVPCCKKCNEVKRAMALDEFKAYIEKVHKHLLGVSCASI